MRWDIRIYNNHRCFETHVHSSILQHLHPNPLLFLHNFHRQKTLYNRGNHHIEREPETTEDINTPAVVMVDTDRTSSRRTIVVVVTEGAKTPETGNCGFRVSQEASLINNIHHYSPVEQKRNKLL